MTLYDFLPRDGSEQTVTDRDYDMETYFYYTEDGDAWDNAMMDLAKLLEVTSFDPIGGNESPVTVNFSALIERHLSLLGDLFIDCSLDAIMDELDLILAGNVGEKWMTRFVEILGKEV